MEYLAVANLILTAMVLVLLAYPRIAPRGKSVRPVRAGTTEPSLTPEALPEGHQWPEKFDEFDGVMERFVCRDCGMSHLRRRV